MVVSRKTEISLPQKNALVWQSKMLQIMSQRIAEMAGDWACFVTA